MSVAFDKAFAVVIGEEGGFTNDRADPGNWTGGTVGRGLCVGTKFGISASSYPTLAIGSLTLDHAKEIYLADYWTPVCGDYLPPQLGLLAFDAAVNNGVHMARVWLQRAAGVKDDGQIGPATLSAVHAGNPIAMCAEFQAQRIVFMAGLPTWRTFGLGWARRLARLPFDATTMETTT